VRVHLWLDPPPPGGDKCSRALIPSRSPTPTKSGRAPTYGVEDRDRYDFRTLAGVGGPLDGLARGSPVGHLWVTSARRERLSAVAPALPKPAHLQAY